mmetsp:Transcript_37903/g.100959  ORF Transcript_37903/g.100959 Transcript_37903/m.100959 type:complete len:220 (-) Transcript_37903:320-979(-)
MDVGSAFCLRHVSASRACLCFDLQFDHQCVQDVHEMGRGAVSSGGSGDGRFAARRGNVQFSYQCLRKGSPVASRAVPFGQIKFQEKHYHLQYGDQCLWKGFEVVARFAVTRGDELSVRFGQHCVQCDDRCVPTRATVDTRHSASGGHADRWSCAVCDYVPQSHHCVYRCRAVGEGVASVGSVDAFGTDQGPDGSCHRCCLPKWAVGSCLACLPQGARVG